MIFVLAIFDSVYSKNNMLGNYRKNFRGFFFVSDTSVANNQIPNRKSFVKNYKGMSGRVLKTFWYGPIQIVKIVYTVSDMKEVILKEKMKLWSNVLF